MSTISDVKTYNGREDEIYFPMIWEQLIDHKWLILIITIISFCIGIFYSSKQIPQYQSDVLIQIEENSSNANRMLVSAQNLMNLGTSNPNSSLVESALIKSRFILEPVIQKLGLDISIKPKQFFLARLFFPSSAGAEADIFSVPANKINHPYQLVYDKDNFLSLYNAKNELILQGQVGSLLTTKNKDIRLQINSVHAPIGTKFLLTKLSTTQVVSDLIRRLKIADPGGRQSTGILEISFRDFKAQQVVRILNEIAKETKIRNAKKKSMEASKTLKFLYEELPLVKKSLEKAELALNRYRASSGKIDIKLQTKALLNQLAQIDTQLATLRVNQIEMELQYTNHHPALIALKKQIEGIEKNKNELKVLLKKLPKTDQIAVDLMRDVKVKSALYTVLLNKIHELQVVKAGTVSNVRILSFAKSPDKPLSSNQIFIYLGSIFLGLVVSGIVIFGRKFLFPKVEDPQWSEKYFNVASLAIIPYSKEQFDNTHRLSANRKQIPLLAHENPRNLSIESLRSLRTSLQINLTCASNNVISILGITPGVGKTFISTNLSYLLATAGKRILLIDADLRKGTIHKYFNFPAAPGLAEVIQGSVDVKSALKVSQHNNLTVLPRGNHPEDPAELLSSERCKELIKQFSQQYDIVVIDTAPILLVTDGVLIGSISGTNYLVLGSNVHRPDEIEMAVRRLAGAGVTLQGSIFNFHNAQSKKNPYYNKYHSYNYYYEGDHEKNKKSGLIA